MKRVIKFEASWCQPCKMLTSIMEEAKIDIPVEKYDIDEHMEYAQQFGIRGVPTLIVMDGNTEIKRRSGTMNKAELEAWVNNS